MSKTYVNKYTQSSPTSHTAYLIAKLVRTPKWRILKRKQLTRSIQLWSEFTPTNKERGN
jgi:hypothetical protein